ncbi:MAG TPA: phosphate/phosphite/phosphonate ABC transporter substrate-binding protein [Tissierellia bacterium]|nr:phosphate/phosphite/phosphonate ABC transporter substrate-binding protein [Tissierellia bacterium]
MKKLITLLFVLLLAISVVACSTPATDDPAPADDPTTEDEAPAEEPAPETVEIETLEVQLIPSRDAAVLDAQRGPLQTMLEEKLDMPVNVTVATDYTGLIEAMKSEKVHVGFLAPASYVLAADQGAAEVVVVSTRYDIDDEGQRLEDEPLVTSYRSQLLAGKDSGITSVADLKGKKIAIASFTSTSGFLYPANLLADNGLDPEADVEWFEAGGHDMAILAILEDNVDAAFTFKDARELLQDDYPDIREEVVYVTDTEPIFNDTISVIPSLDPELKEKIKQAFIEIAATDEGHEIVQAIYNHEGYAEATDADFDTIREYLKRQENWEIGQ